MNFSPGNFIYIYTMVPSRSMNHTRFYDGTILRTAPRNSKNRSVLFVPSFLF